MHAHAPSPSPSPSSPSVRTDSLRSQDSSHRRKLADGDGMGWGGFPNAMTDPGPVTLHFQRRAEVQFSPGCPSEMKTLI
ncbi:hypothetical protein P170DRAFT_436865, partial [Aspergillus steynii IBT 23096]